MNNLAKKLSILIKRRIQFWLQDTLRKLPSQPQFQFCESQIHKEIIYNFYYIQKIIMPKQGIYVYLPTQTSITHVEKEKQDKTFMLACQLRLIYSLLFDLSFLFFLSLKFILTFTFSFFLLACLYQHFSLSGHYYLIAATKSRSVTTTIAKVKLDLPPKGKNYQQVEKMSKLQVVYQ